MLAINCLTTNCCLTIDRGLVSHFEADAGVDEKRVLGSEGDEARGRGPSSVRTKPRARGEGQSLLVTLSPSNVSSVPQLVEVLFGLVFEVPNVLNSHSVPSIDPTEHLTVEIEENTFLCLLNEVLHLILETKPFEFHSY
jgi:hypothetical protein